MASKLQSVVLRAPGIYGLNFEGEAVQATPAYAKTANNVAYDASGRLCNRKGFDSTVAKEATTLGSNPITTAASTLGADVNGIAEAQKPNTSFTLESGSLPPSAPRFLSATTAGSSDGAKIVTITGTDIRDVAVEESITLPSSATTTAGTQLFKTVTSAKITAQPAGNVELGVQASTVLTVTHTAHGRAVGDTVTFSGSAAVDGIDAGVINASHTVTTVPSANSYTVAVLDTVSSGSTAGGGSSVVEKFEGLLDYPDIEQLFMYNHSGGNSLIATAGARTASGGSATKKIFVLASPFTDFVDRTGVTVAGGNDWQFVNFNDKVIGARTANTMIVATTGNFAAISAASGTVPDGNIVHSAFGRLWAQKADTTVSINIIAYCALLDETHWSTGAGEINILGTKAAVAHGYDELVAISSFDRFLVAFLRDSIVIYNTPETPGSMAVEQIIQGIGCIARDSVQRVGNDLYFLSATGVRSLKQVIFSTDKVELTEISKLVRRELVSDMTSGDLSIIKSNYDPEEGQYWLKAPSGNIWVFDMHTLDEKTPVRITKFTNTDWYSFAYDEQETYIGSKGGIGKYNGYIDEKPNSNTDVNYFCDFETIWADFDSSKIKMLKKVGLAIEGASGQQITLKWETDFSGKVGSRQLTLPGAGSLAEWNVGEWNLAEWGGGISLERLKTSASKEGRVLSVGFQLESSGSEACVEQLSLFMKLGREDR